jgi:hypothetical protein
MKRVLALIVVGLLGFYVGWPAYSGYRLHQALEARDEATVARKIDFASVRRHLQPAVEAEISAGIDASARDMGAAGALVPALKQQMMPQLVAATLDTLLRPSSIVRLYAERQNLTAAAERLVMEEVGKSGGLFAALGKAGTPATVSPPPSTTGSLRLPGGLGDLGNLGGRVREVVGQAAPGLDPAAILKQAMETRRAAAPSAPAKSGGSFGLANIKHVGFNGPLALVLGVAKDAAAAKPDVVGEMAFSGSDWRITRIVPVR